MAPQHLGFILNVSQLTDAGLCGRQLLSKQLVVVKLLAMQRLQASVYQSAQQQWCEDEQTEQVK